MNKDQILQLANRGLSLNGHSLRNGSPVDADTANREYLRALASAPLDLLPKEGDTPEIATQKKQAHQLLMDAMEGDRTALKSLNAIRVEQVDNFVKATSNHLSFFEIVTLNEDEVPYVRNETASEISVSYLSQDGKPRMVKIEVNQVETPIELRYISSRKVGYRTQDIYRGNISALAQKTFDIGFDVKQQIDKEARTLLDLSVSNGGAYGAFTFTGEKASRIYVPHSSLITTHLPTTNALTVKNRKSSVTGKVVWLDSDDAAVANESAADVCGFFGVPVLQDILRYCDQWGDIFTDGRLRPTGEIMVPSSDIQDILFGLGTVGANVNQTKLQDDIQQLGYTGFSYGGVNWKFIPDVTIPVGTCFPKLNKLAGRVFMKPSMDKEFVNTVPEEHWETRSQQKVLGLYIVNQRRMNALKLTYKS
jgi:hypothetical protein